MHDHVHLLIRRATSARPSIEAAKCTLLGNEGGKYSLVGEMVVASDADSMYAMLTDYLASPRIFATVRTHG